MSNRKHTPEPWRFCARKPWWNSHPYYNDVACAAEGPSTLPGSDPTMETWEICHFACCEKSNPPDDLDAHIRQMQIENCKRIVACVNALSAYDDPGAAVKAMEAVVAAARVANELYPMRSIGLNKAIETFDAAKNGAPR